MKIVEHHSHLNGREYVLVHRPEIWLEVVETIGLIDAEACRSVVSPEGVGVDSIIFSPQVLNRHFHEVFQEKGWQTSHNEMSKERISVKVHFGRGGIGPFDLLATHMASYVGDVIDVGVEILPMKVMSSQMASGISYYEGELYNVIRQGRSIPAVPLVLIGVAP
jgi:hypothetical protein